MAQAVFEGEGKGGGGGEMGAGRQVGRPGMFEHNREKSSK